MKKKNVSFIPQHTKECGVTQTIFVGCSWDMKTRAGSASYIILDRKDSLYLNNSGKLERVDTIKLLLLSIWSALVKVKDNSGVRIVTNNNAIIYTLNEKNIGNDVQPDIKKKILAEASRMDFVFMSRPETKKDKECMAKVNNLSKLVRRDF